MALDRVQNLDSLKIHGSAVPGGQQRGSDMVPDMEVSIKQSSIIDFLHWGNIAPNDIEWCLPSIWRPTSGCSTV